jgi:SAM-dependent methyltransferase
MNLSTESWSDWATGKKLMRKRFRRVWDIPVIARKHSPIAGMVREGMEILDIGAGGREFSTKVLTGKAGIHYRSMDVDRRHEHDFYSMEEVTGDYDLILFMEVIEHLDLETARKTLEGIHRHLKPDGRLAVSTPNSHNPSLFLSDPTHCLYLNYEAFGALLMMAGFQVDAVYRTYSASFLKRLGRRLATPLFRLLNLDYTTSILILASPRVEQQPR